MNIRMTDELAQLLERTAAHIDLPVSEIARTVARGMKSGRFVVRLENADCTTRPGPLFLTVRDLEIPDGFTTSDFRATLAARCREALAKPAARKFQTTAREGVDYTVEGE